MPGAKTQFKSQKPPAGLPEHKQSSIEQWRANPERVKWWRDILETPEGQDLVAVMRDQRPKSAVNTKGSAEERLGRILGHDEFFHALFVMMAISPAPVAHPKKPGGAVPPHPVQVPT